MNLELNNIQSIANQVVELYRDELSNKNINASSKLSDTATAIVELNGTHLIVSLNLEHYWKYVEYGRRPGKMPPIDAIEEWVKIKPVIPNPINGKVPNTKQLAFLIARKIGREGIEGKKPLTNISYSPEMEDIIQLIKDEVVRQLKQQVLSGTS